TVDLDPDVIARRDPLRRDDASERDEFAGSKCSTARCHAAGQPRECLEGMPEDVGAMPLAHLLAVDEHAARDACKIEAAPVPDRLAEDTARVEEVIRDERRRPERRIVAVAIV